MQEELDKLRNDNEKATHVHNETVDKLHLELDKLREDNEKVTVHH